MGWFSKSSSSSDSFESATARARRKDTERWLSGRPARVAGHRSRGIRKAADQGQAWEDAQRSHRSGR